MTLSWREMLEAMPDAATVLDAAGRILHANAPFRESYPQVRIGQALSRWLRNPELSQALDLAELAVEPVVVMLAERLPVERRIAARVVRLAPRDGEAAEVAGPALLVTFRDLSEQDRLAQMREDFIANASHELRTPLASVKGFIETLQGAARDDAAARERFLSLMAGQAERMTRLIDDLLSLSRIEMRQHLPPRGVVDLSEVAAYVQQTMQPVAAAAGVQIEQHAVHDGVRIRGDRDEIVQVVTNLVQNAILHGGEGGSVRIGVSREARPGDRGTLARLSVSDDGPGIAREHLPRLTERFYRASVSASRDKGGTGLGLAIAKHILARHGGELQIASEVGKGATFAIVLDAID